MCVEFEDSLLRLWYDGVMCSGYMFETAGIAGSKQNRCLYVSTLSRIYDTHNAWIEDLRQFMCDERKKVFGMIGFARTV